MEVALKFKQFKAFLLNLQTSKYLLKCEICVSFTDGWTTPPTWRQYKRTEIEWSLPAAWGRGHRGRGHCACALALWSLHHDGRWRRNDVTAQVKIYYVNRIIVSKISIWKKSVNIDPSDWNTTVNIILFHTDIYQSCFIFQFNGIFS